MAVGLLPDPYYWWEAGAVFGQMVEYWYYTGDTTYNDVTMQGLLAQIGPNQDFMPPNQTKTEVSPQGISVEKQLQNEQFLSINRAMTIKLFGHLQQCLLQR